MGKIITTLIDRFDGGISEDKRSNIANKFSIAKHFDTFTYPHKLVPHYKKMVVGSAATETGRVNALSSLGMVKFLYAQNGTTSNLLFGFGGDVNEAPDIRSFNIDGGDFTVDWQALSNGDSDETDVRNQDVFFYYKGYIYMFVIGTDGIVRYKADNSEAFDDSWQALSSISLGVIPQPVHHPNDDIAYFFSDNFVHTFDGTTFDDDALELPSESRIVDACAYGNYLAIATVDAKYYSKDAVTKTIVYLWDRDSSLTTLTEKIDFGRGKLAHLETLNGKLTAVINDSATNPLSLDKGKILIKQYNGNVAVTVNALTIDNNVGTADWTRYEYYLPATRVVKDDKLYFPMRADLNGDSRNGIWALNHNGALNLEMIDEELVDGAVQAYKGLYCTGNMWWVAYSETLLSKTSVKVYNTDSSKGYSATMPSIYESLIFDLGDSSLTKKLIGATVMTEPLPSAGQVVLKYRLNEQTAWTTIFTEATDDSISFDALNIGGVTLPEFKEIQFRIESTGGAVITGLKFKSEFIDKQLY